MSGLAKKVPLILDSLLLDGAPPTWPLSMFCAWALQTHELSEAPIRSVLCNRQGIHEFVLISCDVNIANGPVELWFRIERHSSSQGVGILRNSKPTMDTMKASTNLRALREPCEARDSFMYNPNENPREKLKFKHIAVMCQYFTGPSVQYSLLGTNSRWICYALLECLRESQPCYGGTWLPSRTERPIADVRVAQLAKSHYLKDKHPTCCGSRYLAYQSFAIYADRATTGLASIAAADPASNCNQDNPRPIAIFKPQRRHAIDNFGASPDPRPLPTASTTDHYSCGCEVHVHSPTRLHAHLPQLSLPYLNPSHQSQLSPWPNNYNRESPPQYVSGPIVPNSQGFDSAAERQSYDDPTNTGSVQAVNHHSGGCTETPEITELKPPTNRGDISKNCEDSSSEIRDVRTRTVIHHAMTPSEIAGVLEAHGCENLSKKLDPSTCSEFPLSSGGLGDVYQAKLDGINIAIKTTRLHLIHKEGKKYLKHAAKELHTWSKCQHPNVIKLSGFVEFRGQIGMVSRWMGNGNAPTFIERSPWVDRCEMCRGICDGLAYLHFIGIIHGDLKGVCFISSLALRQLTPPIIKANVLIADNGTPMLSDFGNSVLCDQSLLLTQTTTQGCISARWTAPEILDGSISCSYAADIYALGMTLLEVITGKPPFCHLSREQAVYHAIAFKKEIPARPESFIPSNSRDGEAFWSLLVACWAYEPEKRPLAADTQSRVKHITHDGLKHPSANALADGLDS
ncbi:Phytosulfokine receptor 1 [Rhizoctonia solani]|uniref:Phytosulfokine receptor 1 n=1 Tax=Rhizoctonia solani TaxID=456999 RepID=A0A0K6GIP5_9AGAM|nr:Phytosulfokine receptor 1 [Rhizoctonia solani]